MKKKSIKIIYLLTCTFIPLSVLYGTGIMKNSLNDAMTMSFFALSVSMYLVGVKLLWPLLNLIGDYSLILRKFEGAEQETLTNENKYRRFLEILEESKSNKINNIFEEFKKTFKKVKLDINEDGEEIIKYYSTNDIELYFNEENIVSNSIYSRTFTQITQALTAVGMFGTFLGIVNGVSQLNVEESDAMKEGIKTLLGGVKISFNSSLFGILFSVILTFALKIISDIIMKKNNEFVNYAKRLISPYTEQSALSDLESELKKQTSTFEQLSTNIVEEMSKNFEESMQKNLDSLSDSMDTIMKEMQVNLSNSLNDNMMKSIVSLATTIQPVMEKLEVTMTKLQETQENTTGKLFEESIGSIKDAISMGTSNEITRLRESMDQISDKNSELLETFSSSMENMKQLALYQENLLKNTTNSTESMNVTTENFKDLQRNLEQVLVNLKDVNSTSSVSLSGINTTIQTMQGSMKNQMDIMSALENMVNKSTTLGESQLKYINKFEILSSNMNNNIENVHKTMNQINTDIDSYRSYFENIKNSTLEVAATLDTKYKCITDDITTANNNLVKTVDSIKSNILDKVDMTGETLTQVAKGLNDFQSNAHNLVNKVEKFAAVEESTQNLWKDYKNSFEELNNNINEGVVNYTKNISEGVNTLFSEYDSNISNAVSDLKKMIEMLNESAENIAESLEGLEKTNYIRG